MTRAWKAVIRPADPDTDRTAEDLSTWGNPIEAMDACARWMWANAVAVDGTWAEAGADGFRLTTPDGQRWTFPHPKRRGRWEAAVLPAETSSGDATPACGIRYALVDADGHLHLREGDWRAELDPAGWAQTHLHPECGMTAFVGRHLGDRPCNVTASVLLAVLGGALRPHAGPVVLTGWNLEEEARDLYDPKWLTELHGNVRRAIGDDDGSSTMPAWWNEQAGEAADRVRSTPTLAGRA